MKLKKMNDNNNAIVISDVFLSTCQKVATSRVRPIIMLRQQCFVRVYISEENKIIFPAQTRALERQQNDHVSRVALHFPMRYRR